MAAQKTNTKKITSRLFRAVMLKALIGSAFTGALMTGLFLFSGLTQPTMFYGLLLVCLFLIAIILIVALIVGLLRTSGFKRSVRNRPEGATLSFDEDVFAPVDKAGKLHLGKEWLLYFDGTKYHPFFKGKVTDMESYKDQNPRRDAAVVRLKPRKGLPLTMSFSKEGARLLEAVRDWAGISAEKEAPAEPVSAPARPVPGTCAHCLGPNPEGAEVCQWCGSRLDAPVFEEPAAAAVASSEPRVSAPAAPDPRHAVYQNAGMPEEARSTGKGTIITIVCLTLILVILLAFMFLK